MSSDLILSVKNLVQKYSILGKEYDILNELFFEVKKNEIVSIEGKSGIGKSTFLNIIGGLTSFYSGTVEVCNVKLEKLSESEKEDFRRKNISFIFQQHLLLQDFSALENVMMPLLINRCSYKNAKIQATEILCKIGLEKQIDSFPYQLSGGESARVGVARALISKKELILADEPTGNLDRDNSKKLIDLILKLKDEFSFALILVTHDRNVASIANRRNEIVEGKILSI